MTQTKKGTEEIRSESEEDDFFEEFNFVNTGSPIEKSLQSA